MGGTRKRTRSSVVVEVVLVASGGAGWQRGSLSVPGDSSPFPTAVDKQILWLLLLLTLLFLTAVIVFPSCG